ncbi:Rieske 2Fe-2S domain-containing protein [Streptomyces tubbatahanensis]|uniref:Rieske 2Fe-2S domain-containing protein n=1 Tax=Streptomyces tubbatahanensis TaxID=2923272 RepID=A0ABY3XZ89_9ACTN|nr:Rieske 2Fe-2S domain-containing protein [Streptomyces tubbatahanensis]UNS99870.1 Rieske 2Fe-2S domain-containing protein [Streptomyces tubbatahanensis]
MSSDAPSSETESYETLERPRAVRAAESGLAKLPLAGPLDRLGTLRALDTAVSPLQNAVRKLPLGGLRDVLHGRWLGHPLHPALVQLPIGAWMSAGVLDMLPGTRRASRVLIGTGILASIPAALSGSVDWAELHKPQLRTGLVHGAANTVALGLYTASLAARARGREYRGRMLGFAGLTVAGAGAMVGGHLAYRQAVGPNKAEPVQHLVGKGWHPVGKADSFPVGQASNATLGEVALLVYREPSGETRVLADRCSHQSGPLSQGTVADGCVTCPWHGSTFRLTDGWNVGGPATAPQPCFESRVREGFLEVRLPDAAPDED